MSTLMVFFYPEQERGFQVMETAENLRSTNKLDLEDLTYVTKNPAGKVKLHHHHNLPLVGATGGAVLGTILGMIFLMPYIGVIVGAAAGAIGAYMSDVGIDSDFLKRTAAEIKPGTGALFLLVRDSPVENVVESLAKYGGTLAYTTLTAEQEDKARELFEATAEARGRRRAERDSSKSPSHLSL